MVACALSCLLFTLWMNVTPGFYEFEGAISGTCMSSTLLGVILGAVARTAVAVTLFFSIEELAAWIEGMVFRTKALGDVWTSILWGIFAFAAYFWLLPGVAMLASPSACFIR